MKEEKTIESEFFVFEGWEESDFLCVQFNNCTLIKDINDWKKGTKFEVIILDHKYGKAYFCNGESQIAVNFRMLFSDESVEEGKKV